TVVLSPAGVRTSTGGVVIPPSGPGFSAADFYVQGSPGATYDITIPASVVLKNLSNNTITMVADNLTTTVGGTGTLDNVTGDQNFQLGATLNVAANQTPGQYVSDFFQVVVNYN